MENSPLISIVLPVYNGEKFLDEAIQSCLDQTYHNFELLIVDDASTDSSLEIARTFQKKDKRIRIITNTENLKLPGSLNIGHRKAAGIYITWTSDDNILKPEFLKVLIDEITSSNSDLVFSDFDIIWENGELKRIHKAGPIQELIFGDTVGASFLYRKEVFKKLEGYNEDLFLVEDYDFFLRASLNYKIKYISRSLYQYRLHEKSLSSKIQGEKVFSKNHEAALQKMFVTATSPLNLNKITVKFIIDLYFNKPIDLSWYFENKSVIKTDLCKFQNSLKNRTGEDVIDILQSKIFWNLYHRNSKLSFKELFKIIKSDHKILFNKRTKKNAVIRFCFQVFSQSLVR